jgi:hypothetical protein
LEISGAESPNVPIKADNTIKSPSQRKSGGDMSSMYDWLQQLSRAITPELEDWEDRVDGFCNDYEVKFLNASLTEIYIDFAVFIFDQTLERVILAYALSTKQLTKRDTTRIRGFPNVNASVRRALGINAFTVDKGHFLGHASGGILDINLFPQRRELNRGWSEEGKCFRKMEKYVAEHSGTLFYHRPQYNDDTWIPQTLEYGVLLEDTNWWIEQFNNKSQVATAEVSSMSPCPLPKPHTQPKSLLSISSPPPTLPGRRQISVRAWG